MKGLDNWITGHYGADYDLGPDPIEDEGLDTLNSAMLYLKPRADDDADEQWLGEYEAFCILQIAHDKITAEYTCRFCGKAITRRKDRYCSKGCYRADMEGL